jgi:hypothetical protein
MQSDGDNESLEVLIPPSKPKNIIVNMRRSCDGIPATAENC